MANATEDPKLWYALFFDVNLPESKQAFDVITPFFDLYLGKRRK
jgi:hypothetical protein